MRGKITDEDTIRKDALRKKYSIRTTGKNGASYEITIPSEVIEREARRVDMDPDNFVDEYDAEVLYNGFKGIHIDFVKGEENQEE